MTIEVLIIDDDQAFKRLIELRLKSFMHGLNLTEFACLKDAREFLDTGSVPKFDLVILDEHLPDGRGVDLLKEGYFEDLAVLTISSDTAPEIPGASLKAGAMYFLNKFQVSEALFQPLVQGVLDRNKMQRELSEAKLESVRMNTVRTLVATLRHEINNPLGAVLGAAYLLRNSETATSDQKEAADLVESSGQRIKHVLDKLCKAVELQTVQKANQATFHIEGDQPWLTDKPETEND